jgi:hypothetical protein
MRLRHVQPLSPRRQSRVIRQPAAANLLNAVNLAQAKGLPLNQLVTINLRNAAVGVEDASRLLAGLRDDHMNPWLRRPQRRQGLPGVQPTFVWSIENPDFVHIHMLVHVPAARLEAFHERMALWVAEAFGIDNDPVAYHARDAYGPPGAAKYMIKGLDPVAARLYGVQPSEQGLVVGKRCGFSENIGPTERRRCVERGEVASLRRVFRQRAASVAAAVTV